MHLNKFKMFFVSLAVLLSLQSTFALERFSSQECLSSNFNFNIDHAGALWGVLKHQLKIAKSGCEIKIHHKKFLAEEWIVDVCREPVHIKINNVTGLDVSKKEGACYNKDNSKNENDFCSYYFDLMDVIQDDGLIFATGDRDTLNTSHGKTYCTYLLLERYLKDNTLFSRYVVVPEIFPANSKPEPVITTDDSAPVAQPTTKVEVEVKAAPANPN